MVSALLFATLPPYHLAALSPRQLQGDGRRGFQGACWVGGLPRTHREVSNRAGIAAAAVSSRQSPSTQAFTNPTLESNHPPNRPHPPSKCTTSQLLSFRCLNSTYQRPSAAPTSPPLLALSAPAGRLPLLLNAIYPARFLVSSPAAPSG